MKNQKQIIEESEITDNLGNSKKKDFLIVGIGASAGGIHAMQEFFSHVPADSGMAYIVILHLSPDHDSRLAEVLQSAAPIAVTQVTEKVHVEPDHVYVVPPNQHLTMDNGHIIVSPNTLAEERRAPVDIFFRTLAEQHSERAVAIILSGTGANGSMGLKRIKEKGGVVFVQNPREAEYSDMPRNAIATELVDEILNVAEIPSKIIGYKRNLGSVTIPVLQEELEETQQAALREIFTLLRVRTGHDFSNYKRASVLRRIERRINVHQLDSLSAYVKFIRETPAETQALLKDLLISVTNFFRDAEAFNYLETAIVPGIIQKRTPENPIRIWIAGCATGEEAYSLAMLLAEKFNGKEMSAIQIFASDIDEAALATAREGFYTLNDAADVSTERLRRFFTAEAGGYRVKKELREIVLFANHNVIKDPPFSHLDLVTCRNMLIYLNQSAQNRVMETFHFALNPGGYLFLGSSESIDGANDLYLTASKEHHVFQSRQATTRPIPIPDNSLPSAFRIKLPEPEATSLETSQEQESKALERISLGDLHQRLLEQYAPPSVIVNENYDVVHLSEKAGEFLNIKGGEPSNNILKLIKPQLRLQLRTALYQALQKQTNIEVKNLQVTINGNAAIINMHVRPVLRTNDTARGFMLIIFELLKDKPVKDAVEIYPGKSEPVTLQLEEELTGLKTQLRSSNEQFEVQTEELKASNEELQAMNEELRSAAEELETSKEELQSINEELTTVNQELKIKIEEVSQSNNDFQNLINSTTIGTVFLDRYLRVKLFTPAAREIFNLIPADIGRPLSDITNKLEYTHILKDAEEVLQKLHTLEREVAVNGNHTYLVQLSPYRTAEDRISGVVIAFVNITAIKDAEKALRVSEIQLAAELKKMRDLYDSSTRIFATHDVQNIINETLFASIHLLNADFGNIQLYDAETGILKIAAHSGFSKEFLEAFKEVTTDDDTACGRCIRQKKRVIINDILSDEAYKPYLHYALAAGYKAVQSTPLFDHEGKLLGVLSTHFKNPHTPSEQELKTLDLYARQASVFISRAQAEDALRESEERLRITMESTIDYAIININKEGLIEGWNSGAEHIFKYKANEITGKPVDIIFTDEDKAAGIPEQEMKTAREEGLAPDERWHRRKDGSQFFMSGILRPIYNPGLTGYVKVARDMTEQKKAEGRLKIAEERHRIALQSAEMAAWDWNVMEDKVTWNEQHYLLLGLNADNKEHDAAYFFQFILEDDAELVSQALQKAVEDTGIYQAEFRIKRADNGQVRWMSGFGRAVTKNDKHATRMVGVMYDITERKKLEQQKDDFIGIASHELKTPVTSIKAYAEVLHDMFIEADDTAAAGLVKKLDTQVDRLIELIRSLLDTTKISEGQLSLNPEQFDITALIAERVEDLQRISAAHHLIVLPNKEIFITADRERIGQVLTNLISNAVKYSPKGGDVTINCLKKQDNAEVSVQDTGIGISKSMQKKVFSRFFRIKDAQVETYPGMGLGLYITANIIHRHGGKIWVESPPAERAGKPGKGSVFYFMLPLNNFKQ